MVETTRVEKYKDYRQEIKKMPNTSLDNPKKTAIDNKKNSLEQNLTPHTTTSLSLDELMSEHSKYVNEEENFRLQEINRRKEIRKKRMFIFLIGSSILLCFIVFALFIISNL